MIKRILKNNYLKSTVSGLALVFFAGCGGGADSSSNTVSNIIASDLQNSSASVTVKAVDGYIKNAIVKDSSGLVAEYNGSGTYVFNGTPVYPLTLSGGEIEDTNVAFDINLTLKNENTFVISPVTTFIDGNDSLYSRLSQLNLVGDFYGDYIETNNTSLAKLSEFLYVVLHDTSLKTNFSNDLDSNDSVSNFSDITELIKNDIYNSNLNATQRINLLALVNSISTIDETLISANEIENILKFYKIIVKNSYKDPSFIATIAKGADRNFTRDDTKEVVIDNATNLIWQDNEEVNTSTKTWNEAVQYCEDLTLGGYTDWRLPSAEELISITDKGRKTPAINSTFKYVKNGNYVDDTDWYWTATNYIGDFSQAWVVGFIKGDENIKPKTDSYYIRCVRDNK
ncbi:MAG: DUF1566 domain-containing protein [Nautiliaceae bacterium]